MILISVHGETTIAGGGNNTDLNPATPRATAGANNYSIYTDDEGTSWHVVLNGTDNVYTTDLPAPTAELGFAAITQVLGGAVPVELEMRRCQFKCNPF